MSLRGAATSVPTQPISRVESNLITPCFASIPPPPTSDHQPHRAHFSCLEPQLSPPRTTKNAQLAAGTFPLEPNSLCIDRCPFLCQSPRSAYHHTSLSILNINISTWPGPIPRTVILGPWITNHEPWVGHECTSSYANVTRALKICPSSRVGLRHSPTIAWRCATNRPGGSKTDKLDDDRSPGSVLARHYHETYVRRRMCIPRQSGVHPAITEADLGLSPSPSKNRCIEH